MIASLAPPAVARAPEQVEQVRFTGEPEEDEFLSFYCGFRVTATSTGQFRASVFYDKDGNVVREVSYPSFRTVYSSKWDSFETADVGMDRFTDNGDGTLTIFGTGIHLSIKGGTKAIGLWVLTFDATTFELLDEEYHGRFDVTAFEIVDVVCSELAKPGG